MNLLRIAARVCAQRAPEAPEWAPFGKWAWASKREGIPEEEDTEVERAVYAQIRAHFASSRTGLPQFTAELLAGCMARGWYASVLHPPPQETLYRGVKLRSRAALESLLGMEDVQDEGSVDANRYIPGSNGSSTSWSAKKRITKDFSESGERGYAVTLIADVAANPNRFLAGPGGLYDVDGLSRWHLEKETVGLEPIIVRRIEWTRLG